MAIKVLTHVIETNPVPPPKNAYTDPLENMFVETIRVHPNFCTFRRWRSTDYTSAYSEIKGGFLPYKS